MNEQSVIVPEEVVEALRKIRDGGKYNMFDGNAVLKEMITQKMYKAFDWLSKIDSNNNVRVNHERYIYALSELT